MIQQQTILRVSDNSGARYIKCIQSIPDKKFAKLGETIITAVQELKSKSKKTSKVLKGEVHKAIVTSTRRSYQRKDGATLRFGSNSVVLTCKLGKTIGTRVLGPLPRVLRRNKFIKLASLSSGFL